MSLVRIATIMALCVNCGDNIIPQSDQPDAGVDARQVVYPPAINWSVWGAACDRDLYGYVSCKAIDGTPGVCVLMGSSPQGTCQPTCRSAPSFEVPCPMDGAPVYDGIHSQGCYCTRL